MNEQAAARAGIHQLFGFTGPVGERFAMDQKLLTCIQGPVGSAKTNKAIRKYWNAAMWQKPGPDGRRRARIGVIRDTYPLLRKTVLASWLSWFPKTMGNWNGESPFTHGLLVDLPGMGKIELEVIFAAIGENRVEDVMRGWELTALHPNEIDLLPKDIVSIGLGRIGRYPQAMHGGCQWRGIFGDMNAPDDDNWTVPLFVEGEMGLDPAIVEELQAELGPMFGIGYHVQPGGRSKDPLPENMMNLPKGYYAQQMIGQTADYIRRFIDNKIGASKGGLVVFPEYQDDVHRGEFVADAAYPLFIMADQGLLAAALVGQVVDGQLRILEEYSRAFETDNDEIEVSRMGGEAFGELIRNDLSLKYPGFRIGDAVCDPAGAAGEAAIDHKSWRQEFQKGLGHRVRKSKVPGNAIAPRLKAVRDRLEKFPGGRPALRIHPRCRMVRRAFLSKYAYQRIAKSQSGGRYADTPLKLQGYSDVMDALQYGCFELDKGLDLTPMGQRRIGSAPRRVVNEMDYDMVGGGA